MRSVLAVTLKISLQSRNFYSHCLKMAAVVAKWPRPAGAWAALASHMGAPISSEMTLAISGTRLVYSATTARLIKEREDAVSRQPSATSRHKNMLLIKSKLTLVEEVSTVLGGGGSKGGEGSLGSGDGGVDIGLGTQSDAGNGLLGRGVDDVVASR